MFIARIALRLRAAQKDAFQAFVCGEGLEARKRPGCVDYSFLEDVTDPARVVLYEEWTNRQAFDAYKASPLFEAIGARLGPMLEAPPKSAYYESDDVFGSCALR